MEVVNDLADRAPRALGSGEVLDIGGHRMRWIGAPHVPHGWEAGVLYDETTKTLLCGDLFTRTGAFGATTTDDIVGPASAAEDMYSSNSLSPASGATIRAIAHVDAKTPALMHGPALAGN